MSDAQERTDRSERLLTDCQERNAYGGGDYNDILDAHRNESKNDWKDEEAAIARPSPSFRTVQFPSYRPNVLPPSYAADRSPPSYLAVIYGQQFARRTQRKRFCSMCCMFCVLAAVVFAALLGSMIYFYVYYMEQPQEMLSETQAEQQMGGYS